MKKRVIAMMLACTMIFSLSACGNTTAPTEQETSAEQQEEAAEETAKTEEAAAVEEAAPEETGELVDGKFADARQITVEIYDRGNDGGSDPENNMYTEYIKKGMKDKYNVDVTFQKVPRWTEVDEINNLLAAGNAPDICVTYSYPTVLTYADMGGVIDLSDLVEQYKSLLPNLFAWLGDTNIYWDKDPKDGTLWAIEGKRAEQQRIVTYVRKDWLDKLGLEVPSSTQQFEDMLVAFDENAADLLGSDANKMVPFQVTYDVGWTASNLITSFMDPNMSDKEFYINGFDDRMVTENGAKEAVRLLNKWYNMGLLWDDFALYGSGDTTGDDMIKAGFVGAFMVNWDQPFRNGEDSFVANLARNVGPEASLIPVDCFENSAGQYAKFLYSPAGDRKLFFPITNDEPLASLLYLDFISEPETIRYLQAGEEGVTHNILESGAIEIIAAEGDAIQNSGKNIDYTITCNGTCFGDPDLATLSLAYGYAGIDPELVLAADKIAKADGIAPLNVNVGIIEAEAGVGDTLSSKRDQLFDQAVVAAEGEFDAVWDGMMSEYLAAGGQAIMDERAAKWEEFFGDADMLP